MRHRYSHIADFLYIWASYSNDSPVSISHFINAKNLLSVIVGQPLFACKFLFLKNLFMISFGKTVTFVIHILIFSIECHQWNDNTFTRIHRMLNADLRMLILFKIYNAKKG